MDNLYTEGLFNIVESVDIAEMKKLSSGDKATVFIVGKEDIDAGHVDLLNKIASAIGIDFEKQAILLRLDQNKQYSIMDILKHHKNTTLVIFGHHEDQIKTQFNKIKYFWLKFGGHKILFGDTLKEISQNVTLKKDLWTQLKSEFDR